MLRWAICSSVLLITATPLLAQEGLTQEEALRAAFPAPARIERRTAYLSEAQLDSARSFAGADVDVSQRVVTYYLAAEGTIPTGVAYFDSHLVRSKTEVVMIVVGRDDRVRQVEILRFDEPPEYRAPRLWVDQLKGKQLDPELSLKKGILNLTGATLTSRALVRATRRMLAIHRIVRPFGGTQ